MSLKLPLCGFASFVVNLPCRHWLCFVCIAGLASLPSLHCRTGLSAVLLNLPWFDPRLTMGWRALLDDRPFELFMNARLIL